MKRIGNNLESETTKIIIKESLEQDNFMLKLNGLTKYIVKKSYNYCFPLDIFLLPLINKFSES